MKRFYGREVAVILCGIVNTFSVFCSLTFQINVATIFTGMTFFPIFICTCYSYKIINAFYDPTILRKYVILAVHNEFMMVLSSQIYHLNHVTYLLYQFKGVQLSGVAYWK